MLRALADHGECGDAVGFCQRGKVKDAFDENIDVRIGQHGHLTDMNQLSGTLAYNLHKCLKNL